MADQHHNPWSLDIIAGIGIVVLLERCIRLPHSWWARWPRQLLALKSVQLMLYLWIRVMAVFFVSDFLKQRGPALTGTRVLQGALLLATDHAAAFLVLFFTPIDMWVHLYKIEHACAEYDKELYLETWGKKEGNMEKRLDSSIDARVARSRRNFPNLFRVDDEIDINDSPNVFFDRAFNIVFGVPAREKLD